MIVLIDNYDSFTFNLVHYLGELGADVVVHRNDKIDRRRRDRRRAGRDRALARPLHAERGRHLPRPDRRRRRAQHSDPRRLPRPSGDRPGLRRQGRARADAGARQALRDPASRRQACSAASTARSRRRAIIRWSSSARACRDELERHGRDRRRPGHGRSRTRRCPMHGVQFHPESIASEHGHLMLKNFLDLAADGWNAAHRPAREARIEDDRDRRFQGARSPRSRPARR